MHVSTGIVLCVLFSISTAAKIPEIYTKCRLNDPNLNKCLVDNANLGIAHIFKNNGVPEFKLQGMNPFKAEKLNVKVTQDLEIHLTEVEVYGFDTFRIDYAKFENDAASVRGHVKEVRIQGKYSMNGKILILPISGNGDCNITLTEFDGAYEANLTTYKKREKEYYKVENENSNFTIPKIEKIHFQFDNLFNGDEKLGSEMNRFLNENWQEVYKEAKRGIEEISSYAVINYYLNGHFRQIPKADFFD